VGRQGYYVKTASGLVVHDCLERKHVQEKMGQKRRKKGNYVEIINGKLAKIKVPT
jgi:hypothetical protein